MATTEFGVNSAQAVKLFSKMTFREAIRSTLVKKLMGTSKSAVFTRVTDLEKDAGDTVKYDLLVQTEGDGITGSNLLEGNEAEMTYYQDSIVIDQLRQAHEFTRMTQQRTIHNMRNDARENLSDWWRNKIDNYGIGYLCGNTALTHGQTAVVPDSDHYIVCGDVSHTGTIATDEGNLSNNDQIDLMDLDYAKEKARTITPMIRPTMIDGEEYYVAILHDYSLTDIRVSTNSSATIKWNEIQQYANVRGLKNPIFSGANGVYNKIIIYDSNRIHSPIASVRRNLFLGAQAGTFAIGSAYDKIDQKKYGDLPMSWVEKLRDYDDKKGIAAGMIFGIKANIYNSKRYGSMIMTGWSASH